MTNPNNAVGTNGAYGGRTSVNAFNDVAAAYTRGIMSGWGCAPDTGMAVSLGGDGNARDVAIAEDNAGNKTTINNISGSPITVTLSAAPGSNTRIDAIVAYVDNPPQGNNTTSDNPTACGLIAVAGTPSASPSAPNDSAIRTAITADGASGTTAYYVVLATITVANGTTDITSDDIDQSGLSANLSQNNVVKSYNIDNSTFISSSAYTITQDNKTTYDEVINCSQFGNGQKFMVLATGYVNINGGTNYGYYVDIYYNGVNVSGDVWANNLTSGNSSVPNCVSAIVTKITGEDTFTIRFRRANATLREIRFNVIVIPIFN